MNIDSQTVLAFRKPGVESLQNNLQHCSSDFFRRQFWSESYLFSHLFSFSFNRWFSMVYDSIPMLFSVPRIYVHVLSSTVLCEMIISLLGLNNSPNRRELSHQTFTMCSSSDPSKFISIFTFPTTKRTRKWLYVPEINSTYISALPNAVVLPQTPSQLRDRGILMKIKRCEKLEGFGT